MTSTGSQFTYFFAAERSCFCLEKNLILNCASIIRIDVKQPISPAQLCKSRDSDDIELILDFVKCALMVLKSRPGSGSAGELLHLVCLESSEAFDWIELSIKKHIYNDCILHQLVFDRTLDGWIQYLSAIIACENFEWIWAPREFSSILDTSKCGAIERIKSVKLIDHNSPEIISDKRKFAMSQEVLPIIGINHIEIVFGGLVQEYRHRQLHHITNPIGVLIDDIDVDSSAQAEDLFLSYSDAVLDYPNFGHLDYNSGTRSATDRPRIIQYRDPENHPHWIHLDSILLPIPTTKKPEMDHKPILTTIMNELQTCQFKANIPDAKDGLFELKAYDVTDLLEESITKFFGERMATETILCTPEFETIAFPAKFSAEEAQTKKFHFIRARDKKPQINAFVTIEEIIKKHGDLLIYATSMDEKKWILIGTRSQ